MFKITNVLNPLTGGATTEEYVRKDNMSLADYMDYDGECVVACGGEKIGLPLDEIFPADKEEYQVVVLPEGGNKETFRVLGQVMMGASPFLPPGWNYAAFMVGGALVSFLQDKKKAQEDSQSYLWQFRNSATAAEGVGMPVIYGKMRVRPILKNKYVADEGDKSVLYALYGLAAHKVDVDDSIEEWTTTPPQIYTAGESVVATVAGTDTHEPGASYMCIRTHDQNDIAPQHTDTTYWRLWHGTASFHDDIVVNGRTLLDYDKDARWETRPGLPEQAIIKGFDVTYTNFAQDTALSMDYPAVVKKEADFRYLSSPHGIQWDEHTIWHNGTTYTIEAGSTTALAVGPDYKLYYDPTILSTTKYYVTLAATSLPSTAYVMFTFKSDSTDISNKAYPYLTALPLTSDWEMPVLTLTNTHNIRLTFDFPSGLYGLPAGADTITAEARLFAQYREVGTDLWLNFASGFAKPDYIGKDGAIHIPRDMAKRFSINLNAVAEDEALIYGKTYEVRVAASAPAIVKLAGISTITYGELNVGKVDSPGFTYPGEPLLGIKAMASGEINTDLDVQIDVERGAVYTDVDGNDAGGVWVYNTRHTTDRDDNPSDGRWVRGNANIHAWAVYDILAQGHPDHPAYPTAGNDDAEAVYGCGIDKDRIDYESFRTWAEYTGGSDEGELGYELNIVFDTFVTAWDAILRICQEGRGMVYPVGTKLYAFTDQAADVTQVFTMGNIHLDTLTQSYVDESQKVSMLEVNYYDQDRNYQKTTIAARRADWDTSSKLAVTASMTLYGTTTFNQAWSIARYSIRGNELLDNTISFGVDVDALAAQVGDVVEVQHDVLTTGQGGRITGVVYNHLLNSSFESALLPNWVKWASPSVYGQSTNQSKYATYSLHTRSTSDNGGGLQTFTVEPETEYTLSCWIYMLNVYIADATIRAMTRATGDPFSKALADTDLLNQWQRVSVTFTTAANQTSAKVYLGGWGEAYFDGVMLNKGASADDFIVNTTLTLDRTLTDVSGEIYQLVIYHNNGTIEVRNNIAHGNIAGDVISFGEAWTPWDTVPAKYEVYAIGIAGANVKKYRITEISRTTELMRTLTLVQYDEDVYTSYVPSDPVLATDPDEWGIVAKIAVGGEAVGDIANLLNIATNLQLQEIVSKNRVTGEYESSIVVTWDTVQGDPRGAWEVWFRDVDTSDVDWQGLWTPEAAVEEYDIGDKVELDGKAYISLEDDNTTKPFSI